ncbi:hypothetical protein EBE87_23405 [Pseudoroseomonas wenyumeiae]|uniref:IclR family transcriptional regulator n=1 Tax=Teichococcus wenyumeiae TaxID=2478470 RepID=A0ABX9VDE8_9PROT|nr:helix-turn-helix domain-containing protein [Pseudoroseomonas wenyumeiae]RMI17297.1 hypothetical protein EBE87_23405 [Pseudoroseomonas wenyumeiae]
MKRDDTATEGRCIKSVGRTFDLLEFFDEVRRPVSIVEVARALAMPQSSAAALLRSLVARGYCRVDVAARRYLPTARVTILGSWIDAPLFEDGALLRLMHEIHAKTGELVLLGSLSGLQVRLIYALKAEKPGRPTRRAGTVRPLERSGLGILFLATFSDRQIGGLVRRINADEINRDYYLNINTVMNEIRIIRQQGYALSLDKLEKGIGGINVLLPPRSGIEPMALSITTLSDIADKRQKEFFLLISDGVGRHLGVSLPPVLV